MLDETVDSSAKPAVLPASSALCAAASSTNAQKRTRSFVYKTKQLDERQRKQLQSLETKYHVHRCAAVPPVASAALGAASDTAPEEYDDPETEEEGLLFFNHAKTRGQAEHVIQAAIGAPLMHIDALSAKKHTRCEISRLKPTALWEKGRAYFDSADTPSDPASDPAGDPDAGRDDDGDAAPHRVDQPPAKRRKLGSGSGSGSGRATTASAKPMSLGKLHQHMEHMLSQNEQLIDQNRKLLDQLQQAAATQVATVHVPAPTTTTTTTVTVNATTTHIKKLSLNLFLNETCKDAVNFQDFINNIRVEDADLLFAKQNGFAKSVARLIEKELSKCDVHTRPIHCTDLKRETLHIKDAADGWVREHGQRSQNMERAIRDISSKKNRKFHTFLQNNAQYTTPDTAEYAELEPLMLTVFGTSGDVNKVIQDVAKTVYLPNLAGQRQ